MDETYLPHDFVCLCCGARNGELSSTCTYNKYVTGEYGSPEFIEGLSNWIGSEDYKGAVVVPIGFELEDSYRERIIAMTAHYRAKHDSILLYALPGVACPFHAVNLNQFLN